MSRKQTSFDIDMELSSSSDLLSISIDSPPQAAEFEFQMLFHSDEKEATTSSADELFYKETDIAFRSCGVPLKSDLQEGSHSSHSSCHLGSCSVSESCRLSCEFNSDEHVFHWSNEMNGSVADSVPKLSWCKKLKQIKQCLLGPKLKASKACIRTLFNKSGCSAAASNACNVCINDTRVEPCQRKMLDRKSQFDTLARRTPSAAVDQRHATTDQPFTSSASSSSSSCSSSSSFSSNRFYDMHWIKRSGTASSENESSIEGAIAHCKQSQQSTATKLN